MAAAVGLALGLTLANAHAQSFTGGPIAISGTVGQSEYSSIQVTGLTGTVNTISLTFNNLNVTNLNSIAVALVSPSGQALDLLSGVCGFTNTNSQQVSSSTFTLADGASPTDGTDSDGGYMSGWPSGSMSPDGTCPTAYSGTYLPTDYYPTDDTFSPQPQSYDSAGSPEGSGSTFAMTFQLPKAITESSDGMNGTWTLYIANQVGDAYGSLGSWTLSFTTDSTNTNTTTSLASNASNYETSTTATVTLTATVTPVPSGTVTSGTVTFADNGTNVSCSGGNPATVSDGTAACMTVLSTEGVHSLTATYSGSSGTYNGSGSSLLNLFADYPTTNAGSGKYCNNDSAGVGISGTLTATNNPASLYPSHIDVSGYSGTITGAALTLNGFTDADPQTTVMLLVGPGGNNIVPWDNIGGASPVNNISFTLADSAGSSNSIPTPPVTGETYYPTAQIGTPPAFPAGTPPWSPPTTISLGPPPGQSGQTFTSAFNGINPNGYWSLFLYNSAGSTATSVGSWCVTLLSQTTMNVGVTNSPSSFTQGDTGDSYTITVTNTGTIPTSGELDLNDSLPPGMSAVSFNQTSGTGWACSGTSCTRSTPMTVGEQDTLTLTVSVGWTTATGPNTNTVTVSGGNLSGTASGSDATTVNAGLVNVTFDTYPTGLSYTVGTGSSTSGTSHQTLANGSMVTLSTTTPQTLSGNQYVFTGWSDGGMIEHTATISSTNGTASYIANFAIPYTLTTAVYPSTQAGSVSPSTGTYGGTVALTATPASGWAFTSWTGPVASSTSASTTITMSGNESATANFAPNLQTTVWIVDSIGGLSELTGTGIPATTTPYTGGNTAVAIDATGNLWTLNSSSPLLYETNQLGTVKNSISSGGGLDAPLALAIDGAGQVWVVNGNGTISLFSNTGSVLSPTGGFADGSLSAPGSIAIDQSGSVWIANKSGNSLTRILGAAAPASPLSTAVANNSTGARP